jgi:mono/diheme cytochrome c family protein
MMTTAKSLAFVVACAGALAWTGGALADDARLRKGQTIAETQCSRCHATGKRDPSPLPQAPPFRSLAKRYPLHYLAEALAEGIVTGHRDMPMFVFDPDQIDALLAYIGSISER